MLSGRVFWLDESGLAGSEESGLHEDKGSLRLLCIAWMGCDMIWCVMVCIRSYYLSQVLVSMYVMWMLCTLSDL